MLNRWSGVSIRTMAMRAPFHQARSYLVIMLSSLLSPVPTGNAVNVSRHAESVNMSVTDCRNENAIVLQMHHILSNGSATNVQLERVLYLGERTSGTAS